MSKHSVDIQHRPTSDRAYVDGQLVAQVTFKSIEDRPHSAELIYQALLDALGYGLKSKYYLEEAENDE